MMGQYGSAGCPENTTDPETGCYSEALSLSLPGELRRTAIREITTRYVEDTSA